MITLLLFINFAIAQPLTWVTIIKCDRGYLHGFEGTRGELSYCDKDNYCFITSLTRHNVPGSDCTTEDDQETCSMFLPRQCFKEDK